MSTSPIDYDALAQKYGAAPTGAFTPSGSSTPISSSSGQVSDLFGSTFVGASPSATGGVDYDALAAKHGAVSSTLPDRSKGDPNYADLNPSLPMDQRVAARIQRVGAGSLSPDKAKNDIAEEDEDHAWTAQFKANHPIAAGILDSFRTSEIPLLPEPMNLPGSGASFVSRAVSAIRSIGDTDVRNALIKALPKGDQILKAVQEIDKRMPSGDARTFYAPQPLNPQQQEISAATQAARAARANVTSIDQAPASNFKPTAPASLPSGRVPGRPAFDAQTGEMLTGVGNGEYSNTIPEVPKITVKPATQQTSAAPSPTVNGRPVVLQEDGKPLMYTDSAPPAAESLSPAEEFAKAIMGKTEGGTIPFNSPHPPAAAFEDAYQGKRAQVIANQLFQHGIPYQDAAKINPESMAPKDWETVLGKDPETGVQYHAPSQETLDQARVLLLHKYAASRTPAAVSAAKALAEEMNK